MSGGGTRWGVFGFKGILEDSMMSEGYDESFRVHQSFGGTR